MLETKGIESEKSNSSSRLEETTEERNETAREEQEQTVKMSKLWKEVKDTSDPEYRRMYCEEIAKIANEAKYRNSIVIQLRWISILENMDLKDKYVQIWEIVNREKLKDSPNIQSKFLSILQKSIKKETIQKKVQKYIEEARRVANRKEFRSNGQVQIIWIDILGGRIETQKEPEIIETYIENVREIANRENLINNGEIQTKWMGILAKRIKIEKKPEKIEAYIEEIRKIACREELKNDVEVQMKYMSVLADLGFKENIDEIKEIAKREQLRDKEKIQMRLEKILEEGRGRGQETNDGKAIFEKINTNQGTNSFLNAIKTRLYYDDLDLEFLDQIKKSEELSEMQRTIALIAIYDKQNNRKTGARLIKEAKKAFNEDPEITKALNIINENMLNKKRRLFDWSNYDRVLGWTFDEKITEEIRRKRKAEEIIEKEKVKQIKRDIEEAKAAKIDEASQAKKPEPKKLDTRFDPKPEKYKGQKHKTGEIAKLAKGKATEESQKKEKEDHKKNQDINEGIETQIIGNVFEKELFIIIDQILRGRKAIIYEDRRLQVKNQYDKVSSEAIEGLKKKIQKDRDLTEDYCIAQTVSEKPISDFRAKMQMVLLLRKYNMKEVADEKLKEESEIYDQINELMHEQRRLMRIKKIQKKQRKDAKSCSENPEKEDALKKKELKTTQIIGILEKRVSKLTEQAMDQISQIEGDDKQAYQLLGRAMDEERS